MKRVIYCLIILSFILLVKIPKYNELNNVHIIDRIEINCKDSYYIVKYREIIPKREDNGIVYKYKYFDKSIKNNNFLDLKNIFDDDNYFYDKANIKNNCSDKINLK